MELVALTGLLVFAIVLFGGLYLPTAWSEWRTRRALRRDDPKVFEYLEKLVEQRIAH